MLRRSRTQHLRLLPPCRPLGAEARPVRLEFEYPKAAVRVALDLPAGR